LWTTPIGQQSLGFIVESVAEAKKVVWPTRQETVQTTLIVVGFVLVVALILFGVDSLLSWLVSLVIG
jgi:preprotein translocase subunit SecE